MLPEPFNTGLLLATFGVLMGVSVLFSRGLDRLGIPVVLFFLVLGMLAGSEGIGGIPFENYHFAFRVGTIALALILFDGGLNTPLAAIRQGIAPAGVLATVGVLGTAALTAVGARLMGIDWPTAMLLGAVVSSTDAAAVFSVLRGGSLRLRPRVKTTLELESGLNDPMAVILTAAVTAEVLGRGGLGWSLAWGIVWQLAAGIAVGALVGWLGPVALRRVPVSTVGLYPVATLSLAFLAFGAATVANASGFLAVYTAAVLIGNSSTPYQAGLRRIHDALAWMSQVTMFLMLGLLVTPSRLLPTAWSGLALGLLLAFVARPAVVAACLLPFRYPLREVGYMGWVGLRGAVPIILATFPVLMNVPGGETLFHLVFFIVVVNALVPGATIRWLTRRLNMEERGEPTPSAVLEINSTRSLSAELMSFYIDRPLAVCGTRVSQVPFPKDAAAVLVVREGDLLAAKGDTVLREGDHVYVLCHPEDRPYITLLFGRPQGEDVVGAA